MTSPVGHSLGGYIVGGRRSSIHATPAAGIMPVLSSLLFIVFAANAADLDFLLGAWMGDFNGYHHRGSHSIAAVLGFTAVVYFMASLLKLHAGTLAATGGLAYASHLALDWLTADTTAPFGLQLFWPVSEQFMLAPQNLFLNIEHGAMTDSMVHALPSIFSLHNLAAIGLELLILGPLAMITFWRRKSK